MNTENDGNGSQQAAREVVTGPVGSASLRDPATVSHEGADLDDLTRIEPEPDSDPPQIEPGADPA